MILSLPVTFLYTYSGGMTSLACRILVKPERGDIYRGEKILFKSWVAFCGRRSFARCRACQLVAQRLCCMQGCTKRNSNRQGECERAATLVQVGMAYVLGLMSPHLILIHYLICAMKQLALLVCGSLLQLVPAHTQLVPAHGHVPRPTRSLCPCADHVPLTECELP